MAITYNNETLIFLDLTTNELAVVMKGLEVNTAPGLGIINSYSFLRIAPQSYCVFNSIEHIWHQ